MEIINICEIFLINLKKKQSLCTLWQQWLFDFLSSVQSLSRVQLFVTPWTAAHQAYLSITNSWSLLKVMSIELVMSSNHLIFCRPILLLPSILSQHQGLFQWSVLRIRWQKYWSFSFSISPSNEYSGLIFFRMDCFDLLAVQGTLRVFSNATVQKHQIFGAQLSLLSLWSNSHLYMTTGKTIALTIRTFVCLCFLRYV